MKLESIVLGGVLFMLVLAASTALVVWAVTATSQQDSRPSTSDVPCEGGYAGGLRAGGPGPPQMPPDVKAERFKPGPAWTGKGTHGMSEAELHEFADFPAFWLGSCALGYNLQTISRIKHDPPPGLPPGATKPENSLTFVYGDCQPRPCAVPISMQVEPLCIVPNRPRGGGEEPTDLQSYPAGYSVVRIFTGAVAIEIRSPGEPDRISELVALIRGVGPARIHNEGERLLPPPNFSACPESMGTKLGLPWVHQTSSPRFEHRPLVHS